MAWGIGQLYWWRSSLGHCLWRLRRSQTTPQSAGIPAKQAAAQPTTPTATPASTTPQSATPPPAQTQFVPRGGLTTVVLDPAHGGIDLGARGTEGIRESEVVLDFAARSSPRARGSGFSGRDSTREGNENPSFDDRSARANAQRGAVSSSPSTSLPPAWPERSRVYVVPEIPLSTRPLRADSRGTGAAPVRPSATSWATWSRRSLPNASRARRTPRT